MAQSFVFIPDVLITLERSVYEVAESTRALEVCAIFRSVALCPANTAITVYLIDLNNTTGLHSIL